MYLFKNLIWFESSNDINPSIFNHSMICGKAGVSPSVQTLDLLMNCMI
jgi:hypothetical protein